jgi:RNA polymerase sigma-70 factor (family 1)
MKAGPDHSSILRGLRRGEETAVRELYRRYYRPLCYFADRILHNKEEAEDLVVETFLKLLHKKDDFNDLPSIKSFLYTAVRNACIDVLRKNKRQHQAGQELEYLTPQEEAFLHDEMLRARVLQTIYEEVEKLPTKCRQVFIALYVKGQSTADVAKAYQISPQTVLNQKSKAIRLLRLALFSKGLDAHLLLICLLSQH